MKFSKNKLEAIKVSAPKERWLKLLFGFPIYHQRYSELSKDDFMHFPWIESQINNKGTGFRYGTKEYTLDDAAIITDVATINPKQEIYLRKIIELCREKDIPLILITTPTIPRGAEQPYYNAVAQIAEMYAVPYYNFNLMIDEIGFTSNCYWTDGAHLNTKGARVVSTFLAELLAENYELEDHRGDAKYHSWEVNAINTQNKYIPKILSTDDYFEELSKAKRSVFLIKNSAWELSDNYLKLVDAMAVVGVDKDVMLTSTGGDWLLTNTVDGEFVNQYHGDLYSTFEFDGQTFVADFINGTGIGFNGKTLYSLNGPGVICVIYDSNTDACIDVVTFLQKDDFAMKHVPIG